MRDAYAQYSGARGFTPDEFRALAEHMAGVDLGDFWLSAIDGTDELNYTQALEMFGLQFKPVSAVPNGRPKSWIGATTKVDSGRLLVAQVKRDTPAFRAGLNVDDEIVAIDQVRAPNGLTNASSNTRPAIASNCSWHAETGCSLWTSSWVASPSEAGVWSRGRSRGPAVPLLHR
jgi:predicted metalloprotease with PDZ domain